MILKGNERGNGKQLALHLLNEHDNEHVEVHEVRGFVSEDVTGAFKESYAISKGTKCRNHLFSLSLNPPENENVSIEMFEAAINKAEEQVGLVGQPRAIVFHEKHGRRHAHCVWSRIDADTMTARNLSHYKNKLQSVSREMYLEHDWKMPPGLSKSRQSDPRNFSLEEWQQCKRMGKNARDLKTMMQDCWAISDSAAGFQNALKERGLVLAKGDRRGHVAVTHEGEVLSISRYVGKRAKEVRERLGDAENLPGVDDAKNQIAKDMRTTFQRHAAEIKTQKMRDRQITEQQRAKMITAHQAERRKLQAAQHARWNSETLQRSARLNKGIKGVWQRVTGQHKRIQQQNTQEAFAALKRDREQRETLIFAQSKDRREIEARIKATKERHVKTLQAFRDDQRRYRQLQRNPKTTLQKSFEASKAKSKPSGKSKPPSQPSRPEPPRATPQRLSPQERLQNLKTREIAPRPQAHKPPERER